MESHRLEIERNMLADRVLTGPEAARHRLVNDRHFRRGRVVLVSEGSTDAQLYSDGAEIIRRYVAVMRFPNLAGTRQRPPLNEDSGCAINSCERQILDRTCGNYAG